MDAVPIKGCPTQPETFGRRVEWFRKLLGMSRARLADSAGLTSRGLANLLRDLHGPRADNLERLATALGVPAGYLLTGKAESPCAKADLGLRASFGRGVLPFSSIFESPLTIDRYLCRRQAVWCGEQFSTSLLRAARMSLDLLGRANMNVISFSSANHWEENEFAAALCREGLPKEQLQLYIAHRSPIMLQLGTSNAKRRFDLDAHPVVADPERPLDSPMIRHLDHLQRRIICLFATIVNADRGGAILLDQVTRIARSGDLLVLTHAAPPRGAGCVNERRRRDCRLNGQAPMGDMELYLTLALREALGVPFEGRWKADLREAEPAEAGLSYSVDLRVQVEVEGQHPHEVSAIRIHRHEPAWIQRHLAELGWTLLVDERYGDQQMPAYPMHLALLYRP